MYDKKLEQVDDSSFMWLVIYYSLASYIVHNEGVCHKIFIDREHIQFAIGSIL